MTTKTIAQMIAELPLDIDWIQCMEYADVVDMVKRRDAEVELLRAALDGLLKVQWQASIDWGCRTDYDNARDEAQEALEVTK